MATVVNRNNADITDAPAGVFGYFRATGSSEVCAGQFVEITMNFGTGSVDIEKQMPSGEWTKIETGIAADYGNVFSSPVRAALRLTCTSYTNPIEYAMKPGLRNA